MNKNYSIRIWQRKDFEEIRKLLAITWHETYHFIPEKDLMNYLNNFYSIEKLESIYQDFRFFCFSVENDGSIIGWMKLFDNQIEKKIFINSLYILPKYQRLGIGKKLMDLAEAKAKEKSYNELWIGVMEQNERTLNWYKKLGFNFIKEEPFKMGDTVVNHFIGIKLINNY
ncbi:MAG: GNAT family N-acetyltransferase [Ignavibacterium sp.]|nr:GNAT family N-acetyltransferase [Ignavibacterium sp.]